MTSRGPAMSRRLNLGCRANKTSTGSSLTADPFAAILNNLGLRIGKSGTRWLWYSTIEVCKELSINWSV